MLFLHPHSAEVILFTPHFTGKKTGSVRRLV